MARAGKQRNSARPAKRGARKASRTDFRAEFYNSADDEERRRLAALRAEQRARRRQRTRVPMAVTIGCFGILFCLLAVGASSAMIWLRKLGAVFGVYWEGDF